MIEEEKEVPVNLGATLATHKFVPMSNYTHQHPNNPGPGVNVTAYVCEDCGFVAFGSLKGPTVWATCVSKSVETLSCDDMIVKDILT